jgi:cyclic pyranopterin phosphate synthase
MSAHINDKGLPQMVDVGGKPVSRRRAVARGWVVFPVVSVIDGVPEVAQAPGAREWWSPKGPVFQTAVIAGIQGAKQTASLIPLCHPLALSHCDVEVEFELDAAEDQAAPAPSAPLRIRVTCTVETNAQTGVEMEALTGVGAACLTIYDMGKSVVKGLRIHDIHLVTKSGGTKK